MRGDSLYPCKGEPRCLICGTTLDLHVHHIYPGSGRREVSDREGCWCYLCARHHNMSDAGVHFNRRLDMELRRDCQRRWERREGAGHDEFRALFGCSYL